MGCGSSQPSTEGNAPGPKKAEKPAQTTTRSAEVPNSNPDGELVVPAVPGALPANAQILFVLGGPGSGKGTQCDRIKARYKGVVHLSAGDLLRAEVASGSSVGKKCETLMKEGKLVPVSVTIQLLKNAMIKSGGNVFLIDGFPRALDQADVFEKGISKPQAVLFFDCPEDEMEKRLLKRGETSGRSDDNAETIRKRFKTFIEQSLPVKDYYAKQNLAHVISAVPPPEVVFLEVQKVLDPLLPQADANGGAAPAAASAPADKGPVDDLASLTVPAVPGSLPADSTVLFVLGGPGSGKGTQCDRIKACYKGVVHLSAGDLLRAEVASGSSVGQKCETLMKEGKLVPVSVTIQLLKNAMIQSGGSVFLIDGFPRAMDQAQLFESDIMPAKVVLFFDCPEDEMEKRLLKRGETSGRSDDNAETIRKRFKTFTEQSLPVKDYYAGKGNGFVISAVPPPEEVFLEVQKVLDPALGHLKVEVAPPPAPVAVVAEEVAAAPAAEAAAPVAPAVEEAPVAPAADEAPAAPAAGSPPEESSAADELVVPSVDGSLPEGSTIIFVLGGPGSGKGTQCDRIKERYAGVVHLSAGDLLRAEVASGSSVGQKCETLMKEGKLVPVSVTIQLLKNAMIQSGGSFFLIDGFPRALDQADVFEKGISKPQAVLFFDCPEDEMEKRLLKRGETSGRSDDNAETIRKRFKTFIEQSLPVKDYYAKQSLAHVISAVPPPEVVFLEVQKVLDPIAPLAA